MSQVLAHFSCGAASAVATKLAIAEYGHEHVTILNAFIIEEHEDNRRFAADCEKWFEHPIVVLRDERYGASTVNTWTTRRYISGNGHTPCSTYLKAAVMDNFSKPNDIHILGYTREEQDRFDRFIDANNGVKARAILIEKGLSKEDCLAMVDRAGLVLPMMYRLGFDNANCIGCPKGGQNYWQKVRAVFPERFVQISNIQQTIGPGAYFLRFRSGPRKGERMALTELPEGPGNMADEPSFSCSFFCEMAEQEIK